MTIVQCINAITDWLNENVCSKVLLKLPDDNQNGKGYDYEEVHPTAFAMYQPGKDKLPPGVRAPFPSVVVQMLEGNDEPLKSRGRMKIQLSFTAWNPGEHQKELKAASEVVTAGPNDDLGVKFSASPDQQNFIRDANGWKDVWNFTDKALEKIENTEYLNGLRVVKELGVSFGQFQVEGQISDLYPYWGSWIILTIERSVAGSGAAYSNLL